MRVRQHWSAITRDTRELPFFRTGFQRRTEGDQLSLRGKRKPLKFASLLMYGFVAELIMAPTSIR